MLTHCFDTSVNEFSKKTGDYASLSLADIKLLALTYELEVEVQGGNSHLNSEPRKIVTEGAATKAQQREEFNNPPEQVITPDFIHATSMSYDVYEVI